MSSLGPIPRRDFLSRSVAGLTAGGVGLYPALSFAARLNGGHPLAPQPSQFEPKARHLIMLFLTGGFSQLDTFDPKPKLQADAGRKVDAFGLRDYESRKMELLASPFTFSRYGESGLAISELFTNLGAVADDLCIIRSMHTDIVEHFQASLAMHTGSSTVPMPSMGSWLSYGLGTLNANLPSYIVLAEHLPYGGSQVFDSSFLPPVHQGVRIIPGEDPIPDLTSSARSSTLHDLEQAMLRDVNELHAEARPGDLRLRARITSFDIARGMMHEAPEVFDITNESDATFDLYGLARGDTTSFAYQCLIARRLIERGVRVVELIDTGSDSSENWDAHGDIMTHRPRAARVDRAIAALIMDLKQRGLFEETLLAGCTEFGRTAWVNDPGGKGRNHYANAFASFLAGAGIKGGITHGATDEYGINIVADPVHVHDYHATILHLMGMDHERLTYRYAGRDFRLTDVAGTVIRPILA